MDHLPKHRLLQFNPDTLTAIRKRYSLEDPATITAAVDELQQWLQTQHHIKKKDFTRHYLETVLISSKGNAERARRRLDSACAMKAAYPQYFGDYCLRSDFKELDGRVTEVALPRPTAAHARVLLYRVCGSSFPRDVVTQGSRIMFMFFEYLRAHDYNDGIELVVDYREASMLAFVTKVGLFEMRRLAHIVIEGYGARLKGIHFLTQSLFIGLMVSLVRAVVSAKIGARVYVHKDLESLHRALDPAILPKELGGQERPLQQLKEEWLDILDTEEFREYLRGVNAAGEAPR